MVVKCCLVVCCLARVAYGHVVTRPDHTENDIEDDTGGARIKLEMSETQSHSRGSDKVASERAGSTDTLYPILLGVAAKILTTIPVFLTSLALMAGFSLATSKAALLLAGVILFYHYLSEGHLITPVSKQWKHLMPDWGGALLRHYGYHPPFDGHPVLGYHRDRNDRRWDLILTD